MHQRYFIIAAQRNGRAGNTTNKRVQWRLTSLNLGTHEWYSQNALVNRRQQQLCKPNSYLRIENDGSVYLSITGKDSGSNNMPVVMSNTIYTMLRDLGFTGK